MQNNELENFILDQEDNDFVRFSWNIWPTSKTSNQNMIIPMGCMYTPMKKNEAELPSLTYQPLICTNSDCKAVLNYLCRIEFNTRAWVCCLCGNRNLFPYNISEYQMPPEVNPKFSTIDYVLPHTYNQSPLVFVYLIDLCMEAEELDNLKTCIKNSYSKLPPTAYVSIITFGQNVYLHDLQHSQSFSTKFCYSGTTAVTKQGIENTINYVNKLCKKRNSSTGQPPNMTPNPPNVVPTDNAKINSRFIVQVQQLSEHFYSFIDEISINSWPVPSGTRSLRATGTALSVAVSLLQITAANSIGRIMTFIGGPCTVGPGKVVDTDLKNVIRSFHDIDTDNSPHVKKAYDFYSQLAKSLVNNYAFDIFASCLDQTGLYEMRNLCALTGGYMVMSDSFSTAIFKGTFSKIFSQLPPVVINNTNNQSSSTLAMYFNGMIEIKMSKELAICGAIGHCYGLGQKKSSVSANEIGIGGTYVWRMASMDSRSTMTFILEYASNNNSPPSNPKGIIQFATSYIDCFNRKHLRVTTVSRVWANAQVNYGATADPMPITNQIANGFDQDAAAAVVARIASFRCFNEDNPKDVLRWVDRMLIKLCQSVATFNKGIAESVNLPRGVSQFTQYMFHLRRSQFLQCFNSSPDETSFYRFHIIKEDVTNVCTMIQPILYSYSMETTDFTPKPALLDSTSIKKDNVLILDTFFQVLVHLGQNIAGWKKAEYHKDPKFHSFARFLQEIERDALDAVASRLPIPRYIYTEFGASQARFLLSKVNPRVTHNSTTPLSGSVPYGASSSLQNPDSENVTVFTDDISFDNFVSHLKKLIVENS